MAKKSSTEDITPSGMTSARDVFGLYSVKTSGTTSSGSIYPSISPGHYPLTVTPFSPGVIPSAPMTSIPAVPKKNDDSHNLERIATALEAIVERFC